MPPASNTHSELTRGVFKDWVYRSIEAWVPVPRRRSPSAIVPGQQVAPL